MIKTIDEDKYFLAYQRAWLCDDSPVKLWEKSRRIGATYVQSYEDVRDCILGKYPSVWFSSADESAAKEYIRYCVQWAELFDAVISEGVVKKRNGKNSYCINFRNGSRITALTSNPKSFRSKGGKVCLDEFAHHQHQEELWKAARPVITWGYPVRILSTHNGKLNRFYNFIEMIKSGELNWSLHRCDINKAIDDGLLEKMFNRKVKPKEKKEWIDNLKSDCADDYSWQEEYLCIPVDESTSFLPYDLIMKCLLKDDQRKMDRGAFSALGVDVGRKQDLTVLWVLINIGGEYTTLAVKDYKALTFREQREEIISMIRKYNIARICIDSTGIGMQLGEELEERYGKTMVEKFVFSAKNKSEVAYNLKSKMQEGKVTIPDEEKIVNSLHSVSLRHTHSGHLSFDAARGDNGHADHFWALALALRAADEIPGDTRIRSGRLKRKQRF